MGIRDTVMTDIKELKIYIISNDNFVCRRLEEKFYGYYNVTIQHNDIRRFYYEHPEIDCLVSPANAFAL